MAIFPDIPGLKAEVIINGEAIKEYFNEEEEALAKTVVKYVEVISDAHFEVQWSIPDTIKNKPGILAKIYLDGDNMRNYVLRGAKFKNGLNKTCQGSSSRIDGRWYLQKFQFSKLRIDDADIVNGSKITKAELGLTGEISVKFWAIKNVRPTPSKKIKNRMHKPVNRFGALSEKDLKGSDELSHHGSLTSPEPTKSRRILDYDLIDSKDDPFATFRFKYRSLAALKALHIIPRTPSPPPLEDRPFEDLGPEELKQLHEHFKASKKRDAIAPRVKKEKQKRDEDILGSVGSDEMAVVATKKRKLGNNMDEAIEIDD